MSRGVRGDLDDHDNVQEDDKMLCHMAAASRRNTRALYSCLCKVLNIKHTVKEKIIKRNITPAHLSKRRSSRKLAGQLDPFSLPMPHKPTTCRLTFWYIISFREPLMQNFSPLSSCKNAHSQKFLQIHTESQFDVVHPSDLSLRNAIGNRTLHVISSATRHH